MIAATAAALTLVCWFPSVTDGDTIRCADERVRIWGVNAVERGQPGYDNATRQMERLTRGRVICVLPPSRQERDGFGRAVRQCFSKGKDIGREMIRTGHAVEMKRYSQGFYSKDPQ